jgi:hypothetical protein
LPTASRAMAAVFTTALFFAIVAAAVASSWRGGVQRSAAMRARTNSAMDGGTSPLISPP